MFSNLFPRWIRTDLRRACGTTVRLLPLCLLLLVGCFHPQTRAQIEDEEREKILDIDTVFDVAEVGNAQPIQVQGVGLVTGLDGSGGTSPPGSLRTMLETELRKAKVANPKQLMDSPDNTLVIVTGFIPAGSRKGDSFDLQITLPPGSKASSLRGGYLQECYLRNFESTKNLNPGFQGADKMLPGHILGKARGPLLVGLDQEPGEQPNLRAGLIWEGGVSFIDRPFYFLLKNSRKLASVANAVAQRINVQFQEDPKKRAEMMQMKGLLVLDELTNQINNKFTQALPGEREMAKAVNKELVAVNVPWEYRLNSQRYILVALQVPLLESKDKRQVYREKLKEMVLDPGHTIRAAIRLEALGKESVPTLKAGLQSSHPLVRFACAESLAYLGDSSGVPELATLAEEHYQLRAYCLTALGSMEDTVGRLKLAELLSSPSPETRYGAFRALQLLNVKYNGIHGEFLNQSFWLHRVAPGAPALVHYSLKRRAEVVLFGQEAYLVPEFKINVNKKFNITADPGDQLCTVSRYNLKNGAVSQKQCSLRVEDVLRLMSNMGAEYPEVVELLRQVEEQKCLNCGICINAIPQPTAVEVLAKNGQVPGFLSVAAPADNRSGADLKSIVADPFAKGTTAHVETDEDSP